MRKIVSCVYAIRNKNNGKLYVGSSASVYARWNNHKSMLNRNIHKNKHLQSSWNKYGEKSFEFEIIEIISAECLIEREQFYINTIKPEYNAVSVAGSTVGYTHTEEAKRKMSNAHKGKVFSEEHKRNLSKARKGRVKISFSEKARQNMSNAQKGKKLSNKHKERISKSLIGNTRTLGYKHTEEVRRKMSEAHKGNSATLGHVLTEEHKQNISAGLKKHHKDKRSKEGGGKSGN